VTEVARAEVRVKGEGEAEAGGRGGGEGLPLPVTTCSKPNPPSPLEVETLWQIPRGRARAVEAAGAAGGAGGARGLDAALPMPSRADQTRWSLARRAGVCVLRQRRGVIYFPRALLLHTLAVDVYAPRLSSDWPKQRGPSYSQIF